MLFFVLKQCFTTIFSPFGLFLMFYCFFIITWYSTSSRIQCSSLSLSRLRPAAYSSARFISYSGSTPVGFAQLIVEPSVIDSVSFRRQVSYYVKSLHALPLSYRRRTSSCPRGITMISLVQAGASSLSGRSLTPTGYSFLLHSTLLPFTSVAGFLRSRRFRQI